MNEPANAPVNQIQQKGGLATASLVLGIVSVVFGIVFGIVLGVLAIIFGSVSLKGTQKGKSRAGIILGSVGVFLNVAAIVGLFIAIPLAIPALQKSEADTQRRSDAGYFMSEVSNYQTNNQGALPPEDGVDSFVSDYILGSGGTFTDPSGNSYVFVDHSPDSLGQMQYRTGATCDGDDGFTAGSERSAAVIVALSDGRYCANN